MESSKKQSKSSSRKAKGCFCELCKKGDAVKVGDAHFTFKTGGKDFRDSVEFQEFIPRQTEEFLKEGRAPSYDELVSCYNLVLAVNGQSAEDLTYNS